MIKIRQENEKDYKEVYDLIKLAFETAEQSDGNEQDLVVNLRKSKSFIPELSLVAIDKGKIVGHILFTKIKIGEYEELALAPIAVLPDYQRQGIGTKLIEEGHRIARELGFNYSVVLGNEKYYSKFNYIPASQYNIKAPFEVDDKNFMAIKLNDNKTINGTVIYDKAFGILKIYEL